MIETLVVYGKPDCPKCDDLKNALKMVGKGYEYIDVTEDNEALEYMMSAGYRSLPQVTKNGEWIEDKMEVLV